MLHFEEVKIGDFVRDQQGLGRWLKVLHIDRVDQQTTLVLSSDITPLIRSGSRNKIEVRRKQ